MKWLRDRTERSQDPVQNGGIDPSVCSFESQKLLGQLQDIDDDVVLLFDDTAHDDDR